jgi:hypothetical protein
VGGTYGQEDKIVAVAVYVSTEKKKKGRGGGIVRIIVIIIIIASSCCCCSSRCPPYVCVVRKRDSSLPGDVEPRSSVSISPLVCQFLMMSQSKFPKINRE